ncbi:MAG: hypothetical protein HXX80_07435 [Nitrososphaerales archaeon]|nr:hypothetical protein [Nitrososphaerales archaeon]
MPKCKNCGLEISWAKDPQTGKFFPVNPDGSNHTHPKEGPQQPSPKPSPTPLKFVVEYGETISVEPYGSRRYTLIHEFPQDGSVNVDDAFRFVKSKVKAWIETDKPKETAKP